VPRPLETSEIPRLVEDYRKAAENAKAAGFDGVEIHSANGYLLDTFLQSSTNRRTDEYGGSVENRFRLVREVIRAVSTVFPPERIGIRFSPNGAYGDMGSEDNYETFSYAISEVNKLGLAYVHLLDGLAFGYHGKSPVFRLLDARKRFDGTLIGNCGYSRDMAEGAIGTGVVDCIAFGRLYLSNPDLVERFANDWPLNEPAAMDDWYGRHGQDPAKGYVDYPTYSPAK
jgi:N-ethylmaleimide reductase